MSDEYEPYSKRKNENRIGYDWSAFNNWGCILLALFVIFVICMLAWIIYDSNRKADTQSIYTDNATDITATCMQQTTYAGELLDCLYAKGFTLVYAERPVRRVSEP